MELMPPPRGDGNERSRRDRHLAAARRSREAEAKRRAGSPACARRRNSRGCRVRLRIDAGQPGHAGSGVALCTYKCLSQPDAGLADSNETGLAPGRQSDWTILWDGARESRQTLTELRKGRRDRASNAARDARGRRSVRGTGAFARHGSMRRLQRHPRAASARQMRNQCRRKKCSACPFEVIQE